MEALDSLDRCKIDDGVGDAVDEENSGNISKLVERNRHLLQELQRMRIQRRSIRNHIEQTTTMIDDWNLMLNAADCERNHVLSNYRDMLHKQRDLDYRIALYSRCNVTNDCFYIWYKGAYGTMNGLRLGFVANPTYSKSSLDDDKAYHGYLRSAAASEGATSSVDRYAIKLLPQTHTSKLTWLEVNTALGLAAHLLYLLQKKYDSSIYFSSYEIMPMGCYSKIGEKQPDQKPSIWYNLFYNEEHSLSFLFSQRRLFNKALNGFGICLADAVRYVTNKDRTLVIPYPISVSTHGIVSIDALPIALGNNGEEWTRAMKYFLTDLKWLVVFTAKCGDHQ
jgi:hypothetical protein